MLGNPPWEQVELKEQEFFAASAPDIAQAAGAARKRLIAQLSVDQPRLYGEYAAAKRQLDGARHFMRASGRFPQCGRGRINLYSVFAEHDRSIIAPTGRLGVIVPTGIATDKTTQYFFEDLVEHASLVSLYDFENRSALFENVARNIKFCLLTLAGRDERVASAEFAFFQLHPDDLARHDARFELSPDELRLLNPNTRTCPVFRSRRDAEITLGIYRRHPVLIDDNLPGEEGNPWGLSFKQGIFNMTSDSHLFHTRGELESDDWHLDGNVFTKCDDRMLPLYEGKMIHHFDHRWATYADGGDKVRDVTAEEKADPGFVAQPRYWVESNEVYDRLEGRWDKPWLLGFRDVTRSTDQRTMVCATLPLAGIGHKVPILFASRSPDLLGAVMSSFVFDFVARQKAGGANMGFFIVKQLSCVAPECFDLVCPWDPTTVVSAWIRSRHVELIASADDMVACLASEGSAFRWDNRRRQQLRSELDAAFFHLFGLDRGDTEYVLGTFPIANDNDPELASRILREYDAMQHAIATGAPYESPLDPPPGYGPRHDVT